MELPFDLISTDFDGTIYAEFEDPPILPEFERWIARLQEHGVKWVINTGRDFESLMFSLDHAALSVQPDYLVLVEREIHVREEGGFAEHAAWNRECEDRHREVFLSISKDVRELMAWIETTYPGTHLYADIHSPMCVTARNNDESDAIQRRLEEYCESRKDLIWVRNDVYSRFSHTQYTKGTALREIAGNLGIPSDRILAAGDHLNDLPMLTTEVAGWLAAPRNAVPDVRERVEMEGGHVASRECSLGVVEAIERIIGES